jgi:hypothetical protein
MSTNSTLSLPNPFTPLAFLPPTIAAQYEASIYVTIATLSVSRIFTCVLAEAVIFYTGVHMGLADVNPGRD